jgi:hypothetical protein
MVLALFRFQRFWRYSVLFPQLSLHASKSIDVLVALLVLNIFRDVIFLPKRFAERSIGNFLLGILVVALLVRFVGPVSPATALVALEVLLNHRILVAGRIPHCCHLIQVCTRWQRPLSGHNKIASTQLWVRCIFWWEVVFYMGY